MKEIELNRIYQGNTLDVLKTFPDECIDTIITSPPYWGLRDYGTAKWVGGREDCDHLADRAKYEKNFENSKQATSKGTGNRDIIKQDICPSCGATREDYQVGLEKTPDDFVNRLVEIFREARRTLKNDGTLWLNLGDSYAGSWGATSHSLEKKAKRTGSSKRPPTSFSNSNFKPKDLVGIPWMVAFALRADGWFLRQDIIWAKPNPMPESVTDRCTKSHEYIFLLSKNKQYFYDADAIKEKSVYTDPRMVDGFVPKSINGKHKNDPQNAAHRKKYTPDQALSGTNMVNHNGYFKANGDPIGIPGMRNKRDVWSVTTSPFPEAHFATFPEELVMPMIKAGSRGGGRRSRSFFWRWNNWICGKDFGPQIYRNRIKSRIYKNSRASSVKCKSPVMIV